MTIFRPSATLKLEIRVEEFENTEVLDALLPNPFEDTENSPNRNENAAGSPQANTTEEIRESLARNQERLAELENRRSSLPRVRYNQQRSEILEEYGVLLNAISRLRTDGFSQPPTAISGTPPDDLTVFGNIFPLSAQIERNGLTTADTATIELDYTNAPFDPRILRAAGVELIIGVVSAEDYEAGIESGQTRSDGSLLSVIGFADGSPIVGATRFVGFVDDWSVKYTNDGDIISLECRDGSALLRDRRLGEGESIDLSVPIDEGVTNFIDNYPELRGSNVFWDGDDDPPIPQASIPTRRIPRRGSRSRRTRVGDQRMSLWDHITDTVVALGFVPIVRGFDIRIIEPRTLYSRVGVQRMIYGRNITELAFSRRLQGVKVPTIEARSYDSEIGRTRWARYPVADGENGSGIFGISNPPQERRANQVPPSGANPSEKILTIVVNGVNDPAVLERVARNSFEEIGRQEIEGTFSTHDVSTYGISADVADLLDMQAGDSIEVLLAAGGQEGEDDETSPNTTQSLLQAMSRRQRRDYLIGLGWSESVADKFAQIQESTSLQTIFRVKDMRLKWDNENGVDINVDFINYIEVREGDGNDGT